MSWAATWLTVVALALGSAQAQGDAPQKVLRYAFRVAETSFDPAQVNDIYSRTVTPHIFEALYHFDPLARPAQVRPLTAAGMPTHSADFRTWTVTLRPGIFFADDPVFKGRPRELVAQDYVYAYKRFADPALKSPAWTWLAQSGFLGLAELRQQALETKKPFDYDTPIDGVRALDRYTLQFRTRDPDPRFVPNMLSASDLLGAVAREVVEHYGDDIGAHPVGTGPFVLKQWRRSSFIALERNPGYRERYYEAEPAAADAQAQAVLARLKGRRLPMIDRVEVSIVEEEQPRWLSFLQDGADFIELLPPEFIGQAMPGGKVAPHLQRRGMQGYRMVNAEVAVTLFNMDNPTLGGYTPDKVALRRAISLSVDLDKEIRLVRNGQAVPAQSPVMPHTSYYDPRFKSENSEYDPAKARALLDMYGFVDKNGDGWRELPDGSPLLLRKATQSTLLWRQLDEQWRRNLAAIGIRIEFQPAQWPENLKSARAGTLMMWGVGSSAADPDSLGTFQRYHGKQVGGQNMARFRLAEFDRIYEQLSSMPDGPERASLFRQAELLAVAYVPYKIHVHRILTDMAQPWLIGYQRPLFWQEWWQYVDIDSAAQAARAR